MNVGNHLVATAQVLLSVVFMLCYFWLLWAFMRGEVKVPLEYKDAFIALLGVMTGGMGVILAYWFQRQRPSDGGG